MHGPRGFPADDPTGEHVDHERHVERALYRRRNDAESINRALDDSLWLRRAHSVGHERQHLNLLTYALVVSSLALHRHRQRTSDPPLTAAA